MCKEKEKNKNIRQNAAEMQSTLSSLLNLNSTILPAYLEITKTAGMTKSWETVAEVMEALHRLRLNDPHQVSSCQKQAKPNPN